MAGTDRSKAMISGGPAIILVAPQLGENIGMAARAMANFGLSDLRLVAPRDAFPNAQAEAAAAGAVHILNAARVYPDVPAAIADLNFVLATTARERGQMKQILGADEAMADVARRSALGEGVGILFGRERSGLENDAIALADAVVTFPVNPAFASLNLAQAVLLLGYEWMKMNGTALLFATPERSPPPTREGLLSFFDYLEGELDSCGFFVPAPKKPGMIRNLRNIFHRMKMTEQDLRTLRGAVVALVNGRRGGRNAPHPGRHAGAAMPPAADPQAGPDDASS
ncbi:RNA methyltransferase [Chelatococcus asaccharovorans]|uniref:tRNA/rRNA methyltransferase n=1 Tax=Chelatococcus asaccharovorans TaxID=28210 RepID=A0A2V3TWI9_9HYPH|nr:RNA methyltransferase [Chelatococcus asaccharovorans]MBS7704175.1 RNA methyltransferase [Chelatococcus asaccharovorans]PXW53198.1 tRNA/rRNA methyltransferase [Chelatococcus asaccharovorans]CAH1665688.1 tRNA/rRNA methyltransferase [Chelatococcus asaccharovorans]CAH1681832.1 tRNA/rRNA methyltransferase [Chelatococcus asaccharovorans]